MVTRGLGCYAVRASLCKGSLKTYPHPVPPEAGVKRKCVKKNVVMHSYNIVDNMRYCIRLYKRGDPRTRALSR